MIFRKYGCLKRPLIQHFRRNISIQPINTAMYKDIAIASAGTVSDNVIQWNPAKSEDLAIQLNKDEPSLQVLGVSQSILSLTLPPSMPAYIKRGSIISVFASSKCGDIKTSITSSLKFSQPLQRLLSHNLAPSYQRLQSLVPLNIMVSAYSTGGLWRKTMSLTRSPSSNTFCNIFMDGSIDWALFDSKALHTHIGNSLFISNRIFPKVTTDGEPTGLSRLFKQGYTLLSGRGWISLVGEGSIFKLKLEKEEEILVKRKNLLACTIKDPSDLKVGSFTLTDVNSKTLSQQKLDDTATQAELFKIKTLITKTENHTPKMLDEVKALYLKLRFNMRKLFGRLNIAFGNGTYIKIRGPRLFLINSGTGRDIFQYGSTLSKYTGDTTKLLKPSMNESEKLIPTLTEDDNLSVLSIKKDGAIDPKNSPEFKNKL